MSISYRMFYKSFYKKIHKKKYKVASYLLALCLCVFLSSNVLAQANDVDTYYLLADETKQSINQIEHLKESEFKKLHVNDHVGQGDYWLRISVPESVAKKPEDWFLQVDFPNIDFFEIYYRDNDFQWKKSVLGDEIAFISWPVKYHIPTVALNDFNSEKQVVYARVSTPTPLIFPVNFLSSETLYDQISFDKVYYFSLASVLVTLIIYNLAVYFSLRDRSYLYYVCYISIFFLLQLSVTGLGQQYLWPGLDGFTTRFALACIALTNFSLLYFVVYFLSLGPSTILSKAFKLSAWLSLASLLLLFFKDYLVAQHVLHIHSLFNMIFILTTTVYLSFKRNRPARYLTIGYMALFFAILLALAYQNGLIELNFWVKHGMELALIFEALVLSLGLSDKISVLRGEKIKIAQRLQKSQNEFSKELLVIRDKERFQLGKALHDNFSHDLIALKQQLSKNDGATQLADALINKVQDVSLMMHPFSMRQLGFSMAAESMIEKLFRHSNIDVQISLQEIQLEEEKAYILFSVLQEALNNIVKHANASEVIIKLSTRFNQNQTSNEKENMIELLVADDGQGGDVFYHGRGLGLRMARQSLENIGGHLAVESKKTIGTKLLATIPLCSGSGEAS